jgi:hypothetical protein
LSDACNKVFLKAISCFRNSFFAIQPLLLVSSFLEMDDYADYGIDYDTYVDEGQPLSPMSEEDPIDEYFREHPEYAHLLPMYRRCFEGLSAKNKRELQEAAREVGITVGKKTKDQLCRELFRLADDYLPIPMVRDPQGEWRRQEFGGEWALLNQIFMEFARIVLTFPFLVAHQKGFDINFPQQINPVMLIKGKISGQPIYMELQKNMNGMLIDSTYFSPSLAQYLGVPPQYIKTVQQYSHAPGVVYFKLPESYLVNTTYDFSNDLFNTIIYRDYWRHPEFQLEEIYLCLVDPTHSKAFVLECRNILPEFEKALAKLQSGHATGPSLRKIAVERLEPQLQAMVKVSQPFDPSSIDTNHLWQIRRSLQRLDSQLMETRQRSPHLNLRPHDLDNFLAYQAYINLVNRKDVQDQLAADIFLRMKIKEYVTLGEYSLAQMHLQPKLMA